MVRGANSQSAGGSSEKNELRRPGALTPSGFYLVRFEGFPEKHVVPLIHVRTPESWEAWDNVEEEEEGEEEEEEEEEDEQKQRKKCQTTRRKRRWK